MRAHKILIVEDEAVTAMALEDMLADMGYAVLGPCGSGEQALALAAAERPDLALLDVRLEEGMDGIVIACALRERLDVGSIFITGEDSKRVLAHAAAARPLGFLGKPYSYADLRAVLESALNAGGGGHNGG